MHTTILDEKKGFHKISSLATSRMQLSERAFNTAASSTEDVLP